MADYEFEKVELPRGTFVGWAVKPGQKMTARVLSYSDTDGKDFNGEPCPLVVAELIEPFDNYRDKGTTKETLAAGELVSMTCGLSNLKRNVKGAALEAGNVFRLEFSDLVPTDRDPVKIFDMQVARTKAPTGVAADSIV